MLTTIALIIALVLAAIDELNARGRALTTWAVIIVILVLLLPIAGKL